MTRGGHGRPLFMAPFDKPGILARGCDNLCPSETLRRHQT